MLIFFIHGVAEAKVKFAKPLEHLIKEDLSQRGIKPPYFHSGFYADILNNKSITFSCRVRFDNFFKSANLAV
jgi:hypothetical protein